MGEPATRANGHVERRLALLFPGFEPLPAAAHARRFIGDLASVAPLYGMTVVASEPEATRISDNLDVVGFRVQARGKDWATDTEVVIYGLAALNDIYSRRNPLWRAATGYRALAELAVRGAIGGYASAGRRFLAFYLYPPMLVVLAAVLGIVVWALASIVVGPWIVAAALGFVAGLVPVGLALRHLHLLLALDLWSYTRDLAERRVPEVEAIRSAAARDAAKRASSSTASEVLFCGHSMGAVVAAEGALAAIAQPHSRKQIGVLTVGGSLPQVGFDPAAGWLREIVADLARAGIDWIDVSSKTDIINFARVDLARDLGRIDNPCQRVIPVRFRDQLSAATYRAMKTDMFRIHRQFVRAVEARSAYSWHAVICGPEWFSTVRARGRLAASWGEAAQ